MRVFVKGWQVIKSSARNWLLDYTHLKHTAGLSTLNNKNKECNMKKQTLHLFFEIPNNAITVILSENKLGIYLFMCSFADWWGWEVFIQLNLAPNQNSSHIKVLYIVNSLAPNEYKLVDEIAAGFESIVIWVTALIISITMYWDSLT